MDKVSTVVEESFSWYFPGGSTGLILIGCLAAAMIIFSYIFTIRKLPVFPKVLLIFIRIASFGLILFCLSNPTAIRKETVKKEQKNKVMVLLDVSSSMRAKGFEKETRMKQAMEYWHSKLIVKDYIFEKYTFGTIIRKVDRFLAFKPRKNVVNTHLYKNLGSLIEKADQNDFSALICFTDGVDSSEDDKEDLMEVVESSEIPIYFIPTDLKVPSKPFIGVEKLEVDSISLVGTKVPVNMLVHFSNTVSRPIVLKVKKAGKLVVEKN